jgi:hypothetical protein
MIHGTHELVNVSTYKTVCDDLDTALSALKIAREALEFYAVSVASDPLVDAQNPTGFDDGARARTALAASLIEGASE